MLGGKEGRTDRRTDRRGGAGSGRSGDMSGLGVPVSWLLGIAMGLVLLLMGESASAQQRMRESDASRFVRVLTLQDYNTRVVLMGTSLLGISGGVVGSFMLLRKQSLVADVVGHSALPGIAMAFILTEMVRPGTGKSTPILLCGALLAGLAGAVSVILVDRFSKVKSDAALAIVLSVFYGLGTALLTVVQDIPTASAAGLKDYLNGKTASLIAADVWLFAASALALVAITVLLFKELTLICFDPDYAQAGGWPVFAFDTLLIGLVVGVTIVGMQSVGLILVVAILVTPAASARFWTDDIRHMTCLAGAFGGGSALAGTVWSAAFPKIAAGAVIVLAGGAVFLFSLLFGSRRGVLWRWVQQRRMRARIGRHDLLRAIYEQIESASPSTPNDKNLLDHRVPVNRLLQARSWTRRRVESLIRKAEQDEFLRRRPDGTCQLTSEGAALARTATRNHRLWELYLITYAETAPSRVDRDADLIEHVLEPEVVHELEARLAKGKVDQMPVSPHS